MIQINGRKVNNDKLDKLVKLIKKKKELNNINNQLVIDEIIRFLKTNSKDLDGFLSDKKKHIIEIQKKVRAQLRRLYGSYNDNFTKRKELFSKLKKKKIKKEDIIEILNTHQSTKERISFYQKLYDDIFNITGKPKSILDIGCGLNPLSFVFMKLEKINKLEYRAHDISLYDLEMMENCFNQHPNIKYKYSEINLLKIKEINLFKDIEKSDVAFFFKILEIIEQSKSHKISEEIIKKVPSKWVIVSFPTRTISGNTMNFPKRGWLERMLQRLDLEYKILEYSNEIFYVIKKE